MSDSVDVYSAGLSTILCIGGCQVTIPISLKELGDKVVAEQQRLDMSDVIGKKVKELGYTAVMEQQNNLCGRSEL